jgi:hypothetical protein
MAVEATAAEAGAETMRVDTTKPSTLNERKPSPISKRRMRYGEGYILFFHVFETLMVLQKHIWHA